MAGEEQRIKLQCVIENVVYYNEENDYAVLDLVGDGGELISATGTVPLPSEGEVLSILGYYEFHREYGKQFHIDSCEKSLPTKEEDIITYLSSRAIKGVGPVTALKIVNKFGTDTFDVMQNHPEWLADIPGITRKKAIAICEEFRQMADFRGVFMFCQGYMDSGDISRVYKRFGSGAVGLIRENPYVLCEGELGLPFERVDKIASALGIAPDSTERIFHGIRAVLLREAQAFGHTALPLELLLDGAVQLLCLERDLLDKSVEQFLLEQRLFSFAIENSLFVMTEEVFRAEVYICQKINKLYRNVYRYATQDIEALIQKVECASSIQYAPLQRKALFRSVENGVMIMTGGPGTGKTTVIKAMIRIFESLGQKVVLCAPTGRAAKRMSEATGEEARTVHRLLEMEKTVNEEAHFNRNQRNPLEENVVIVDEASMMDLFLTEALMRALPRSGRLILIGDSNQLPSVGAGNVLSDLIASERVETVCLTDIFRQSEQSLIITNAHKIQKGEYPVLSAVDKDFFFVNREDEGTIPETVASLMLQRLPRAYGDAIRDRIQVITPSKKGSGGVLELNQHLQAKINPPAQFKKEKSGHGVVFREGDRVMQTVNDYEISWEKNGVEGQGIFNGDIGRIESIHQNEKHIRIRFDDRVALYPFDKLKNLELSYAITVHKSQGSEYPVIIVPIYSCAPMLLTRNLLYTAVTRARSMVILVGRAQLVRRMVDNTREITRYTSLKERLIRYDSV